MYRQDGRQTWAYRFYQDGRVEEYSDSEMTFEDGKIVTREIPLAWRAITQLPPAELEKLVAIIRRVDFFALPDKLGVPSRANDAALFTWTVRLDGKKKTVVAAGAEATSHPAIKILRDLVQEVTTASFERESKNKDSHPAKHPDGGSPA